VAAPRDATLNATSPSNREADVTAAWQLIRFVQWRRLLAGLRAEARTYDDAGAVLRKLHDAVQRLRAATPDPATHCSDNRVPAA
jgi:hypothetical protein